MQIRLADSRLQKSNRIKEKGVKMDFYEVIMAGGLLLILHIFAFCMWIKEIKEDYEAIEPLNPDDGSWVGR